MAVRCDKAEAQIVLKDDGTGREKPFPLLPSCLQSAVTAELLGIVDDVTNLPSGCQLLLTMRNFPSAL